MTCIFAEHHSAEGVFTRNEQVRPVLAHARQARAGEHRLKATADGFGIGSALYKPGMTVADVRARARDVVRAYDEAIV